MTTKYEVMQMLLKLNSDPVTKMGFINSKLDRSQLRSLGESVWKSASMRLREHDFLAGEEPTYDCIRFAASLLIKEVTEGEEDVWENSNINRSRLAYWFATTHYAYVMTLGNPMTNITEMTVMLIEAFHYDGLTRDEANWSVYNSYLGWLLR